MRVMRNASCSGWDELSPVAIRETQLSRLNSIWPSITAGTPYFSKLLSEGRIPNRLGSWEEFKETVPPMTRSEIKRAPDQFIDASRPPDSWRTTGGSTAEPLRVPVWSAEVEVATRNIWSARGWFGVRPS